MCRWSQAAYAELAGVSNAQEAAARVSAALGIISYPVQIDEVLRLCNWLKSRSAANGCLGKLTLLTGIFDSKGHGCLCIVDKSAKLLA